jgi:hypothetical protein
MSGHTSLICSALALLSLPPFLDLALADEEFADPTCALEIDPDMTYPRVAGATIDSIGTFDALVLFAEFPDGQEIDSNGQSLPRCTGCGDDWLPGDTYPPDWADSLIDNSTASLTEGSVTHFFDTWSQGRHALIGTVLDTVLVSSFSIVEIDTSSGYPQQGDANLEILAMADSALGGLASADLTSDGSIDFVFIHYQSGRALDSGNGFHTLNPDFTAHLGGLASYTATDGTTAGGNNGAAYLYPYIRPGAGLSRPFSIVGTRWPEWLMSMDMFSRGSRISPRAVALVISML